VTSASRSLLAKRSSAARKSARASLRRE
jgi:hypothetical protein